MWVQKTLSIEDTSRSSHWFWWLIDWSLLPFFFLPHFWRAAFWKKDTKQCGTFLSKTFFFLTQAVFTLWYRAGLRGHRAPRTCIFLVEAAYQNSSYHSDSEHSPCSLKQLSGVATKGLLSPKPSWANIYVPIGAQRLPPKRSPELRLQSPLSTDLSVIVWLALRVNTDLPLNDKILRVLLSLLTLAVIHPRRNTIWSQIRWRTWLVPFCLSLAWSPAVEVCRDLLD